MCRLFSRITSENIKYRAVPAVTWICFSATDVMLIQCQSRRQHALFLRMAGWLETLLLVRPFRNWTLHSRIVSEVPDPEEFFILQKTPNWCELREACWRLFLQKKTRHFPPKRNEQSDLQDAQHWQRSKLHGCVDNMGKGCPH